MSPSSVSSTVVAIPLTGLLLLGFLFLARATPCFQKKAEIWFGISKKYQVFYILQNWLREHTLS
jgi:hypothetical protein